MAGPGDLDTSFAGTGRRAIEFGGVDAAHAVLVQPNGRIVVAGVGGELDHGRFCLARLRSNGALDTTFGSGGKRRLEFGGQQEQARGAALQPDGKIVLVGSSDYRAAVARLNPNGSFDTTFSGDGKKIFGWGPISVVMDVRVLPNGKLLLAGYSGPEGGNMQVARMNSNGALDTTFGTAGRAAVDFGGDDFGNAVARQANGRIVVAGHSTVAGAVVARLRATGALDPDFNGDGRVTLPGGRTANAVRVQPDRKIVVAGTPAGSLTITVHRLLPNGSLDTTFDGDGTASIDFGNLSFDFGNDLVLQPNGKIVVAGYTAENGDFAVARLNTDGSLDTTFGTPGRPPSTSGSPPSATPSPSRQTDGSSWPASGRAATTSPSRGCWAEPGRGGDCSAAAATRLASDQPQTGRAPHARARAAHLDQQPAASRPAHLPHCRA